MYLFMLYIFLLACRNAMLAKVIKYVYVVLFACKHYVTLVRSGPSSCACNVRVNVCVCIVNLNGVQGFSRKGNTSPFRKRLL